MPFRFSWLCELLEDSEKSARTTRTLKAADKQQKQREVVRGWFHNHRRTVLSPDTDLVAILSTLFPERRTDRVYHIQAHRLLSILSRVLGLGRDRLDRLKSWRSSTETDLASWTASIVRETDDGKPSSVTVERIDKELEQVASRCRFSSPQVQALKRTDDIVGEHEILGPIIRALPSTELKWLIRLILKDFGQIVLDEHYVQSQIHFLLPRLLQYQSTFSAAVSLLRKPALASVVGHTNEHGTLALTTPIRAECLRPSIGVKIGRPNFIKARSLKQVIKTTQSSRWSIEPKYDGEYCQIHIDLANSNHSIQIFAKSGRDATKDRSKVHDYIRQSLKLDTDGCTFRKSCIVEGELIVYDDQRKEIAPFHKIRKHVTRSGSFLGTDADSQAHPQERLMIIYYDCLAVDDEVTMALPYTKRRRRLNALLHNKESAKLGDQAPINRSNWGRWDFSKHSPEAATKMLQRKLSDAIAQRCEGLILKPCDQPYFSLDNSKGHAGSVIKLKKDYIAGLGDTADFAIIGARRDLRSAGNTVTEWTHFTIATIENKDEVHRFGTKPIYRIVESLTRPCISVKDMEYLTRHGCFRQELLSDSQDPACCTIMRSNLDAKMDVVFTKPFIAEVLGSGFDKPSSCNHWMLRHPRITKVHSDRGLEDVVSFDDLQTMANDAMSAPEDTKIEKADWQQKIQILSRPKRKPLVVCNRSPNAISTMTESVGTNLTTPSKSPRARGPIMVRMDSCEALRLPETSAANAAPHMQPVDHDADFRRSPLAPLDVGRATEEGNRSMSSQDLREAAIPGSKIASAASDGSYRHNRLQAFNAVVSPDDRRQRVTKRGCPDIDAVPSASGCNLKRARTEPDLLKTNLATLSRSETNPEVSTKPSRYCIRRTTSGHPGESQCLFYLPIATVRPRTPCLGLDGAMDDAPAKQEIAQQQPESVFSAPWTDLQAQLLKSSPRTESSPVSYNTAPSRPIVAGVSSAPSTSPTRRHGSSNQDCYMTPPSTRSPHADNNTSRPSSAPGARSSKHEPISGDLLAHFRSSTIYLPPNLATHAYLSQILLPRLQPAHSTSNSAHWQRDLYPSANASITVAAHGQRAPIPDSQALPNLHKIILIEPRMPDATAAALQDIVDNVQLAREKSETVDVWDWRIVEELVDHMPTNDDTTKPDGSNEAMPAKKAGKWYQGHVRWSQSQQTNVFDAT